MAQTTFLTVENETHKLEVVGDFQGGPLFLIITPVAEFTREPDLDSRISIALGKDEAKELKDRLIGWCSRSGYQ